MTDCIFCKIVKGAIPSRKVYEDNEVFAFHDVNPVAPVHFMIIPKQHIDSMAHLEDKHRDMAGRLMVLAGKLAKEQGCNNGFRAIINTGPIARQEVQHLHVHIMGGPDVLPPMLARGK